MAARWLLLACLLPSSPLAEAQSTAFDQAVETSGDLLQFAIPLTALGFTFLFGDQAEGRPSLTDAVYDDLPAVQSLTQGRGLLEKNVIPGSRRGELVTAVSRAYVATYGLKYAIDAPRPNGGSESFPSGHTALSFTGAAFINKHYGWKLGVPAYLAAGYVGWSRVHSNNHTWADVAAGAAIGIASNYFRGDAIEVGPGQFHMVPSLHASEGGVYPGVAIGFSW